MFVAAEPCCSSFALVAVPCIGYLTVHAGHLRGNLLTIGGDTVGAVVAGTAVVAATDTRWAAPSTALTDLGTTLVALGMTLVVGIGVADFSTPSDSAALLVAPCFL